MKKNITFIVIAKSYMISKTLSEIILDEFQSVRVLSDINDIDYLLTLIEKSSAVFIIADKSFIEFCNRYLHKIPQNTVIIPIIESKNFRKECLRYKFCIDLYDDKRQIVDVINKAVKSVADKKVNTDNTKELTARERIILQLVAKGKTTREIADKLGISVQTVSSHRKNISAKLEIKSVSGLTAYAIINGLINIDESSLS